MELLRRTLDTPAQNLALDEALLDAAEVGERSGPLLRVWESPDYVVVLGRSSVASDEVDLTKCRQHGVSVLRRASGGGTVVVGPGSLCYAVVLDLATYPQLCAVDMAHQFVLGKLVDLLAPMVPGVCHAGISDLAVSSKGDGPQRKFSGNALRIKRRHILYHGTLLYDFDLARIDQLLATSSREPEYRGGRPHREFVTNLGVPCEELEAALVRGWGAVDELEQWPETRVVALVDERYTLVGKWLVQGSGDSESRR